MAENLSMCFEGWYFVCNQLQIESDYGQEMDADHGCNVTYILDSYPMHQIKCRMQGFSLEPADLFM
jgi:hypothetical protein